MCVEDKGNVMDDSIFQRFRRLPPEIRHSLQADLEAGRLDDLLDRIAISGEVPEAITAPTDPD